MTRQRLLETKAAAKKFDFNPRAELIHTLVDHGLEALTELEGGASVMEQRAALKERERQVKLALEYLRDMLEPDGVDHSLNASYANRVRYTVDTILQMLKAKGPQWTREWSHYVPRIEEEFGA